MTRALDLARLYAENPPAIDDTLLVTGLNPTITEWAPGGGGGPGGGVPEAPQDGTSYLRRNGAWTDIIDAGTFP